MKILETFGLKSYPVLDLNKFKLEPKSIVTYFFNISMRDQLLIDIFDELKCKSKSLTEPYIITTINYMVGRQIENLIQKCLDEIFTHKDMLATLFFQTNVRIFLKNNEEVSNIIGILDQIDDIAFLNLFIGQVDEDFGSKNYSIMYAYCNLPSVNFDSNTDVDNIINLLTNLINSTIKVNNMIDTLDQIINNKMIEMTEWFDQLYTDYIYNPSSNVIKTGYVSSIDLSRFAMGYDIYKNILGCDKQYRTIKNYQIIHTNLIYFIEQFMPYILTKYDVTYEFKNGSKDTLFFKSCKVGDEFFIRDRLR